MRCALVWHKFRDTRPPPLTRLPFWRRYCRRRRRRACTASRRSARQSAACDFPSSAPPLQQPAGQHAHHTRPQGAGSGQGGRKRGASGAAAPAPLRHSPPLRMAPSPVALHAPPPICSALSGAPAAPPYGTDTNRAGAQDRQGKREAQAARQHLQRARVPSAPLRALRPGGAAVRSRLRTCDTAKCPVEAGGHQGSYWQPAAITPRHTARRGGCAARARCFWFASGLGVYSH